MLYIAVSVDGFIADSDGGLDFLSMVETEGEDYGYGAFMDQIDTVIMGRKTYDKILSMGVANPHADKTLYVLSRSMSDKEGVHRFEGPVADLVSNLKATEGKSIFCDGGADTIQQLLKENLMDTIILSIIPVLLGEGIRLFDGNYPSSRLQLIKTQSFSSGLVQLEYECLRQHT